jgi:hypothetical protein
MPRATENDLLPYESKDPIGKRVRDLETHYAYGKWRVRLFWFSVIVLWWIFWSLIPHFEAVPYYGPPF